MESPKELFREWFERVWNQGDEAAIFELMHPEGEILGLGTTVMGREVFAGYHRAFRRGFSEILIEIVDLVGEDEAVAGHARFSAVHGESGREVDIFLSFAGRFEDGKLRWVRNVVDFTALLSQVGSIDPRAVNLLFEP
jgi:ketosteroid isomerase-like protein